MPFTILSYNVAAGVNDANVEMTAVADTEFNRRGGAGGNNRFLLTEEYQLLAASYHAVSALRARMVSAVLRGVAVPHIFPVNTSLLPPANPQYLDLRSYPLALPSNDEIGWEESNNLAAATEQTYVHMWLGTMDWSADVGPIHKGRVVGTPPIPMIIRAQAAPTLVAQAWSAPVSLTFPEQTPRAGRYRIIGAEAFATNGVAFRLNFPTPPLYQGRRKMKPGDLCLPTATAVPRRYGMGWLGIWGRYATTEFPQIEFLGNAAGTPTAEVRILQVYEGESVQL